MHREHDPHPPPHLPPPHAAALLDAAAHVLHATPPAHALFAKTDGLHLRAQTLQAWQPAQDSALRARIAAATRATPPPFAALRIARPSGARPYELLILPLPNATCILTIRDPAALPAQAHAFLAALYALTPREARLALALISGATVAQAAAEARVKPETTRTHLKALYAKTGATRQHQLVAHLAGALALLPQS